MTLGKWLITEEGRTNRLIPLHYFLGMQILEFCRFSHDVQ